MPAHGGIDPGAVGSTESGLTVYEADVTLPIELEAMRLLTGDGFRVVVSRTRAESVVRLTNVDVSDGVLTAEGVHNDVAARDICANDAGANILIGIYMDAGEGGAGSLTGYDPDRPFAAANLRLAALVQDDVLAAMKRAGVADPRPRDTARHRGVCLVGAFLGCGPSPTWGLDDPLSPVGPQCRGWSGLGRRRSTELPPWTSSLRATTSGSISPEAPGPVSSTGHSVSPSAQRPRPRTVGSRLVALGAPPRGG
jgi:N-acetylmuramoyl-L-alanine amidase